MMRGPRNAVSLVIWAAAALAAAALWLNLDPSHAPMSAIVEADVHRVGPVAPARLVEVYVRPGASVARGDPVAALDSHEIDAALTIARAEQAELLAEVEAKRAAFNEALRARRLEIQSRLAEARSKLADAKVLQAGRKAEMDALAKRLDRLDGALRDGLVEVDRLTELRARGERLAREARYGPETLAAWSSLDRTVKDMLEAGDPELNDQLRPLRARLETQALRIEGLLAERARAVLRAPVSGQVQAVLHQPGDALAAGEPVVEVVAGTSREVVAYAPEEALRALTPGTRVALLTRDEGASAAAEGVVAHLGPAVVPLPQRLWLAPTRPQYGRAVHVLLEPGHALLPGEAVTVVAIGGAHAAAVDSGPSAMVVPPALSQRSRLEPSGAIWLADLDRFLIVSDDTGPGGASEHQPWLFLADAGGRFDPEPLVIDGAPPVSDLESITVGPDGAIYLLASQSLSRKGRRKAPRQQLLRVARKGRQLQSTGAVALFAALADRWSPAELRALGADDDLDIEGMAFAEGGLLLGLKAPIEAGEARIWLVTGLDALFAGRGFGPEGAQIKEYARVALPTGHGDGGISDLLLEGDTLYLLSTLPEGPPQGAAWRATLPLRKPPERLAAWDFKAEALVRHPDGLFVFFDTGADAPRFTRLAPGGAPRP